MFVNNYVFIYKILEVFLESKCESVQFIRNYILKVLGKCNFCLELESDNRMFLFYQDPRYFCSKVTGRGPLPEGWRDSFTPIMCSYKVVHASFEIWGLQTKAEELIQKVK